MAQVPLAKHSSTISCLLKLTRQGGQIWVQEVSHASLAVALLGGKVSVQTVAGGKTPRHESRATRRTYGTRYVKLREQGTLPGQSIQIGCVERPIAVAAQIPPAQIIGQNEDDVGRFGLGKNWPG